MMITDSYLSPISPILLAAEDEALVGLWFPGQKYLPELSPWPVREDAAVFQQTRCWLDRYFAGERPDPRELRLAPKGTAFRRQVWELLLEIPYGETTTYGALARRLAAERGLPHMSAQAVGGAVGHNPISIIIPCHRVLGADGSLTGYAGGVEVKRRLLEGEGGKGLLLL